MKLFLFLIISNIVISITSYAEPTTLDNPYSNYADLVSEFRAQHHTFLRLATGEGKDIELRYLYEPDHDIKNTEEANIALSEFHFSAEVPIIITPDIFIRILLNTNARVYDLHSVTILGDHLNTHTLYKTQVGTGLGYFIDDSLLLTGVLTPGLFSTFNSELTSEQARIYGELFLIYGATDHWQFITGVITDELFEEVSVYPVLALRYRSPNGKIHLKVTPPVSVRAGYQVSDTLQLYGGFFLTGERYRVHLAESGANFDLRVQDKRLGIGFLQYLDTHWNISFEIGASLTNKFDFKLSNDESLPSNSTDSTVYSFISLGYAL